MQVCSIAKHSRPPPAPRLINMIYRDRFGYYGLKWSAYGWATGVSLVRLARKRHFPSDTLVGATVGYITGTYLAKHADD